MDPVFSLAKRKNFDPCACACACSCAYACVKAVFTVLASLVKINQALVWAVYLTIEIKIRFQIYPA